MKGPEKSKTATLFFASFFLKRVIFTFSADKHLRSLQEKEPEEFLKQFNKKEGRIHHVVSNNPSPVQADLSRIREQLEKMGENLKLARLRRRIRVRSICARAGISRTTLWSVENGAASVSIGIYAQVLFVLGLEHEISKWGTDDRVGQKIQDEELRLANYGEWRRKKLGLDDNIRISPCG